MDYRFVRGGFAEPGPAVVWMRMRQPLVAGEEPSPLQRVLVAADSGNGVSATLDWTRYLFINVELTVHLHRALAGEWVCLDAITIPEPNGVGIADTALYDERGPIGRAMQALLVGERETGERSAGARPKVLVARACCPPGMERLAERCEVGRVASTRAASGCWRSRRAPRRSSPTRRSRSDDELLDAAGPQLRVVANFAVGYDNVDLDACRRRGVAVTNTPGVLTNATAELALALTLAAARRMSEAEADLRDGRWVGWDPGAYLGLELSGATFGVVGHGPDRAPLRGARRAARRRDPLRRAARRSPRPSASWARSGWSWRSFSAAPTWSASTCPASPETSGLIGRAELRGDAAARGPRQHRARPARRLRRPRRGPARRRDRGRRPGRLRGRAAGAAGAARGAALRPASAHRLGDRPRPRDAMARWPPRTCSRSSAAPSRRTASPEASPRGPSAAWRLGRAPTTRARPAAGSRGRGRPCPRSGPGGRGGAR